MPWTPRVTVAAVVERGGRFLLVQERSDGLSVLNQPAGHLEAGESLLDAVRREALEETAHRFEPSFLVGIYRWVHPDSGVTYVRFALAGDAQGPIPGRGLDDEIETTLWLTRDEITDRPVRSPLVLATIDDYLAGSRFSLDCLRELDSDTL